MESQMQRPTVDQIHDRHRHYEEDDHTAAHDHKAAAIEEQQYSGHADKNRETHCAAAVYESAVIRNTNLPRQIDVTVERYCPVGVSPTGCRPVKIEHGPTAAAVAATGGGGGVGGTGTVHENKVKGPQPRRVNEKESNAGRELALESEPKNVPNSDDQPTAATTGGSSIPVPEMLSGLASVITDKSAAAKNVIASKLGMGRQGYDDHEHRGGSSGREQDDSKGGTVPVLTEYLAEKLRPGEEDKALSEVITDNIAAIQLNKNGVPLERENKPEENDDSFRHQQI